MESDELQQQDLEVVEFGVQEILPIVITFMIIGIGSAISLQVMGDIAADMPCNSGYTFNSTAGNCYLNTNASVTVGTTAQYNATQEAIDGVAVFPEKLGVIALVIVAAIIIGILARYLLVKFS